MELLAKSNEVQQYCTCTRLNQNYRRIQYVFRCYKSFLSTGSLPVGYSIGMLDSLHRYVFDAVVNKVF